MQKWKAWAGDASPLHNFVQRWGCARHHCWAFSPCCQGLDWPSERSLSWSTSSPASLLRCEPVLRGALRWGTHPGCALQFLLHGSQLCKGNRCCKGTSHHPWGARGLLVSECSKTTLLEAVIEAKLLK